MNIEQTYWFDSVPQHWQIKRLKDIASLNNDRTERKDMPYIALENIKSWDAVFVPSVVETDGINNVYHKGNVLFAKLRPYLAKGYITREDGICSTEFFVLSPNKLITNKYLLYYILSHSVIDYLKHQVAGTKMPRTTWDDFSNVKVALPPLAEQIKIANYLDDKISGLNAQILAREKELQLLQDLKKAKVAETVTKGPSPDVTLKDSGIPSIGMIPAHWEVRRLKDVCTCNDETLSDNFDSNTLIKYVEISDVTDGQGITNISELLFSEAPSRARRITQVNDIIVSTVRTYLKAIARVTENDLIVSTGFAVLRPKKILSSYLHYLMTSSNILCEIIKQSTGTGYPAITSARIMELSIPVPQIDEQLAIASYLNHECEQIEKKCALIDKQIQQLQLLKRALINEVVTGKKAI
jgi:type I restriction enzyme S subunit